MKIKHLVKKRATLFFILMCSFWASAQKITGIVSTKEGLLPGASVLVKNTTKGVVTDLDGRFEVEATATDVLIISFVGYAKQEITVGNQSNLNILMEEDNKLNELVVIGYGTQRKSDLTGSVSSVDVEELANIPNSRVDQMMQGRTAGVQVTSQSGSPGAGTSIRVRGGNSIVGDNEPLWVIDGIIVGQNFDLNNINTNDIKSIEVLKDASSIAIYGSRGANGVILVTTKGGNANVSSKPQISIGVNSGSQAILRHPEFMTGPEHVAYTNEDARFRKLAEPFPNPSGLPDNNWKELLTQTAPILNADASINGSTEGGKVSYYVSGNYFNQEGVVKGSDLSKLIFRSNIDVKLTEKLKTGLRFNISNLNRGNPLVSYGGLLTQLPERAIRDAKGNYTGTNPITTSVAGNPLADLEFNIDETKTNNLLGTLYLDYSPIKNLTFRTTINPEINNVKTNIFYSSQLPDIIAVGDKGSAVISTLNSIGWNNENTLQYNWNINDKNYLTALAGASFQKYKAETSTIRAFGIASDATTFNNVGIGADPTRSIIGTGFDAFQIVSFFGRINYSLNNKYLFTLVGRSDGSSRFATGNKYAFFPSAAFAWRLGEEDFIKNLGIFSNLKLRASYGKAGSQAIDSYRTLALMEEARTTYNGTIASGTTLGRPLNPNLKWETTTQLDVALEASFLNGRVSTEINYYDKVTSDLLLEVRIPRQSGFESRLQNLGKLQNRGLDVIVSTTNISKKDFKWSTDFTVSGNRNKVLDLGGVTSIDLLTQTGLSGPPARLIVGETAHVFTGLNFLGTWKKQEDIVASKQTGQVLGGPRFDDPNGDGRLSIDEYYNIGSPQADFIYGIQNNIKYKGFELSFFFQGTQGNDVFNTVSLNSYFTRGEAPKYKEVINRWTPTNTASDVVGVGYLGAVPPNSFMVEDGSHIRLKTLRVAYTLPLSRKSLSSIQFHLTGNNVWLRSKTRMIDPESSQYGKSDQNGNVLQGFVSGQYPNPRILTAGINLSL
jgi:TonB-dependent starch-binding outer membrane protein SusC